jgi:hypothetical protein
VAQTIRAAVTPASRTAASLPAERMRHPSPSSESALAQGSAATSAMATSSSQTTFSQSPQCPRSRNGRRRNHISKIGGSGMTEGSVSVNPSSEKAM